MTKKDYQAIASIIFDSKTIPTKETQTDYIVAYLADYMAIDNPLFDRDRFAEACLTGKCKGMRA
jgi:hypothetical protein